VKSPVAAVPTGGFGGFGAVAAKPATSMGFGLGGGGGGFGLGGGGGFGAPPAALGGFGGFGMPPAATSLQYPQQAQQQQPQPQQQQQQQQQPIELDVGQKIDLLLRKQKEAAQKGLPEGANGADTSSAAAANAAEGTSFFSGFVGSKAMASPQYSHQVRSSVRVVPREFRRGPSGLGSSSGAASPMPGRSSANLLAIEDRVRTPYGGTPSGNPRSALSLSIGKSAKKLVVSYSKDQYKEQLDPAGDLPGPASANGKAVASRSKSSGDGDADMSWQHNGGADRSWDASGVYGDATGLTPVATKVKGDYSI
jgi:hypothetical protein